MRTILHIHATSILYNGTEQRSSAAMHVTDGMTAAEAQHRLETWQALRDALFALRQSLEPTKFDGPVSEHGNPFCTPTPFEGKVMLGACEMADAALAAADGRAE